MNLNKIKTFALCALVLASALRTATAAVVVDNIKYALNEDAGTAEIVGYEGEPEILSVSTVEHDGRSYAVTSVSSRSLRDCNSLRSVSLPQVTSVGARAFYDCASLSEVDLPRVVELGGYAFIGTPLTRVVFPNLERLEERCFWECKELVEVDLPLVTNLPPYALKGCKNLKKFSCPNLTHIDTQAMWGCSSLEFVSLPKVEVLGAMAFYDCSSLTNAVFPCLKELGQECFSSCAALDEIELSSVTNVPAYAFSYCRSLRKASFPAVTRVEERAFFHCESLTSVSLPKVEEMGQFAFCYVPLTEVSFSTLKSVGEGCFSSCRVLVDVNLPAVTKIGDRAFEACRKIETISVPALTTVGEDFFTPSAELRVVELGGWRVLPPTTFAVCNKLTDVKLTLLEQVPAGLFRDHATLRTVDLPSAEYVEAEAFFGCSSLEVLNLPVATLVDGNVLDGARSLRVFVLPGLETVSAHLFENCSNLSVVEVGEVGQIGESAFAGCGSLSELAMTCLAAPTVEANAFSGIPSTAVVKVLPWAEGFPAKGEKWNGLTVDYFDEPDGHTGVTVNGVDVGTGESSEWTYADNVLTLTGPGPFVLSGRNAAGGVSVVQAASSTVILSNLVLKTATRGKPTFMVGAGEVKADPANAVESVILLAGVNKLTCEAEYTGLAGQCGIFVNNGSTVRFDTADGVANDECVLFATGGKSSAAIGGGHYCSTGKIIIDGGTIVAAATSETAADIGNGVYDGTPDELPGEIVINGGIIKASTIGSAKDMSVGLGFDIRVTGGTIVSTSEDARGIYSGSAGTGRNVLITGGSIRLPVVSAVNAAGERLYRARLTGDWADGTPIELGGLEGYGTHDLVAMDGEVDIWFVEGLHFYDVNGVTYRVIVSESVSEASRYEPTGVTINGVEIVTAEDHGDGWTFADSTAVLTGNGPYYLSGTNLAGAVHFEQTASKATVILSDLVLQGGYRSYKPLFRCGANTTLKLKGDNLLNNDLFGASGELPGVSVPEGCKVTIQALEGVSDKDARLTAIGCSSCAGIGGSYHDFQWQTLFGTIVINSGTIVAQGGYGAAGIGHGLSTGVHDKYLGSITINGGIVTARGGILSTAIGWGHTYMDKYGKGCDIRITGGTVFAERGEWKESAYATDYKDIESGMASVTPVRITGGNVIANEIVRPENGSQEELWRVTVPCGWSDDYNQGVLTGLSPAYNIRGSYPYENKLYIWLPSRRHEFQANNAWYIADVRSAPTKAVRISEQIGEDVEAVFHGQEVRILGSGRTYDYAGAPELPWYGLDITTFLVDEAVIPGANLFAGLSDAVSINGSKVSILRQLASGFSLGGVSPAEAKSLAIENGEVKLTVEVEKSADLKTWEPAKTVEIAVPVEGEKGFYILKSK